MFTGPVKVTDQDIKMIPVYDEAEKAALEQARLDALMAWDGRGEIPAIVWDGMSAAERKTIERESDALMVDNIIMGIIVAVIVASGAIGGAWGWACWEGLVIGTGVGLSVSVLTMAVLHIPYWRAPRPPRLGAVLRWTAEEMVIRQRARIEARGYQAGELTEVKQVGDLRVIEGGRS